MIKFLLENPVVLDVVITAVVSLFSVVLSIIYGKNVKFKAANCIDIIFQVIDEMEKTEEALTPLKDVAGRKVGAMKKEDVITKIQNYCLANDIEFNYDVVSETLEKLIDFSKKVNHKEDKLNG